MQLIRCTAKLRKEMGVKDSALCRGDAEELALGPWHANLIRVERRKCVLFVNDKTLFNFIAPNVSRSEIRGLHQLFLSFLYPVLSEEGFTKIEREKIASEYKDVRYAKTTNKSVLGSMNDLAFHYEHRIMVAGGIFSHEVPAIISALNRMPMGPLDYAYAVEELRNVVQGKT